MDGRLITRELRLHPDRDVIEMSRESLIGSGMVSVFHPLRFDITKYAFLLCAENMSGGWNSQCRGKRARLLRSNRAPD